MYLRFAVLALLSAIALVSVAAGPTYSIDAHIISNGTSTRSTSGCYRLDATIAEPIVGYSSGGQYGLSAGFSYLSAPVTDTLFANGFEDCAP